MPNFNCQVSGSAIAFIDPQVTDYQSLIAGVKPGTEVVVLDGDKDAIEQITEILGDRKNIDSIHIISHGAPGSLQIGNGSFCAGNLSNYSGQLKQWRSAFAHGAEILIYGCNVAGVSRDRPTVRQIRQGINSLSHSESRLKPTGDNFNKQSNKQLNQQSLSEDFRYETGVSTPGGRGESARDNERAIELESDLELDGFTFIQRIAQLTNTNVAASKNLTGSTVKGGDWELEVTTGEIKTSLIFEPEALAGYEYVLNSFKPATNFTVGTNPVLVDAGDFNGDGIKDLAVTNSAAANSLNGAGTSILLGNTAGSFDPAINLTQGRIALAIANFNQDRYDDLVVDNGGGSVSIFFGSSSGLGAPVNLSFDTRISAEYIAVGNFNDDNRPDIAIATTRFTGQPNTNSGVSILLQNLDGTFSAPVNSLVGRLPQSIAVGDFDSDGKQDDLAVSSRVDNTVSILLAGSNGVFTNGPTIPIAGAYSIATGKFDADNTDDLAVTSNNPSNTSILLQKTPGTFTAAPNLAVSGFVAAGDIDGDGKTDLAFTGGAKGVSVRIGKGNGEFSSPIDFSVGSANSSPSSVVVKNIDGDSRPDIAATNFSDNTVSVLLNTPPRVSFDTSKYSNTVGVNEQATDTPIDVEVTISNSSSFGDIVVPILIDPSSTAIQGADYTLSTNSLTFPANTTTLTQKVTVTIKADNIVDSNEQLILNLGQITGGVVGGTSQVRLSILDRNSSYTIANTPTVTEGNSGTTPATFTITRNGSTELWSTVDYAITGTAINDTDYNNIGGTSGATAATGKITFAAGETSKTITLDVLGDAEIEPNETVSLTLSNPVSPGGAPTIPNPTATSSIATDDTPGFTVNPKSLSTTETGGTAQFTVKLNAKPTANVSIALSSDNTAEGTVSTDSLIFTPDNWSKVETVTVTGVDDLVADESKTYNIITAPAFSTDLNFNDLNPDDVAVTNSDDETPGITVNPTAGLTTTEKGDIAKFSVVLNTQPTNNVTVGLSSSNTAEGAVSTESITFTIDDWNRPKEVTVTGVNDSIAIADGDIEYKIITANTVSNDQKYSNLPVVDVSLSNKDDDSVGVSVTPTEITATEGGANGTYTVVLKSQPTDPVTIALTTGNQIQPIAPLTFTAADWNIAQTVTVKAVGDTDVEGAHSSNITHIVTSTDTKYNKIPIGPVSVAIVDTPLHNDPPPPGSPDIIIDRGSGLVTTEAGGTERFTIKLNSQPTADVTIDLRSNNVAEGVISTPSITFNSSNWNVAKEVTVTGIDDSVVDGDIDYKIITDKAVSTDPNYTNREVADVSLSNKDNDVAPPPGSPDIIISPVSGLVTTEAGGTEKFTIKLNSQPTADVTIDLRSNNVAEGVISTPSITFNSSNWDVAKEVTVTGVDDSVVDGDIDYKIITDKAVSTDPNYTNREVADVSLRNTDNDVEVVPPPPGGNPGIIISPASGLVTTESGGTDQFTIRLNSQPKADVIIGVRSSNEAEGVISTDSITFNSTNWNQPQPITITGVDDRVFDRDKNYQIVTAPAVSADRDYNGLDAPDALVVNTGNAIPRSNARTAGSPSNDLPLTEASASPTVNFSQATYKINESPTEVVQTEITLTRTGDLNSISKVYLQGLPSSATLGTDWNFPPNFSRELTFNPGENSKIFTIDILPDGQVEGTEKIEFQISNRDNANIGTKSSATLQIFDPDSLFSDTKVPISVGPSAIWGDYNNDGKLDILGSNVIYKNTQIYDNTDGITEYGFSENNRTDLRGSNSAWGDYNNDGRLDVTLSRYEYNNTWGRNAESRDIYSNRGNDFAFETTETTLPDFYPENSYVTWGDSNNDGRLDILRTGPNSSNITTRLYRNEGAVNDQYSFQDIGPRPNGNPLPPSGDAVAWGDYDNDGKLDILLKVPGATDNWPTAKVYRNLGDGAFADIGLELPGLASDPFNGFIRKDFVSSVAWGDYNNDGKLDILLTSEDGEGKPIVKVYRNKTSINDPKGFYDSGVQIPGLYYAQATWGDYDNDGSLDILLTGRDHSYYEAGKYITKIYRNTSSRSSDSFDSGVEIDSQPDGLPSSATWGDYDSDGKLDILLANASTKVFHNNTPNPNTPPTAPTGLTALPSSREVTFNWNKATDTKTPANGLSYNLRVGTTPGGQDILSPMSLADGTRQLVGLGNVSQNTKWQLKDLSPNKKYYWSVQAIDTAWAGSEFAEEGSFTTVANRPPVLNYGETTTPWHYQYIKSSSSSTFEYAFPQNTFTDPDEGDKLTYTATLMDGSPLPTWLTFYPGSRTLSGTSPKPQQLTIKLTATDKAGASASDDEGMLLTFSSTGVVIDGYIDGATLFLDANKNGIKDTNEPSTTTDSGGKFDLNIPFDIFDTNKNGEIDPSEGHLVAIGGTDTATGLPLETPVTAPPDSTVVTLLTSLVADLIDKGIAPEEAQSLIKAALSLPAEVDLTSLDPILATNNNQPGGVQVLAAMVKVQNFITQTAASIDGASSASTTDIVKAVVSSIANQVQSGAVLNLSNAAVLAPIIQQSAAKIQQIDPSFNSQQFIQIIPQAATVMAAANQRIDTAVANPAGTSIPEAVARVQQVALGATSQDFKAIGSGNKTISQVVAENTGAALDNRLQAVVLPVGIATPVVTGDADLGSNSGNPINGTNGDDILTGTGSNDVLMGMRGNDSLDGAAGNDTIFGGKGFDNLLGNSGDDALYAGRGADNLNGGDGNDSLYGGKSDDLLNGGLGSDTLIGGMGLDKFLLSANSGTDTIADFEMGKDLFVLSNGLTFSQLAVVQENSQTFIRVIQTGETLAILNGIPVTNFGSVNFGSI
ncbi:MAG: DUF4347 domain-containing protein [Microcoleus sp.]